MLDLFITERVTNLINLVDNPALPVVPSQARADSALQRLRRVSESFVDLGFFGHDGQQLVYAGPFPELAERDYSSAAWFQELLAGDTGIVEVADDAPAPNAPPASATVVTDIYLGFRNRPHFTIAVRRDHGGHEIIARATLDPEKIYDFVTSLAGVRDVGTAILNREGTYQLVTPGLGSLLGSAAVVPPREPRVGHVSESDGAAFPFGYAWLEAVDWALLTRWDATRELAAPGLPVVNVIPYAAALLVLVFLVILVQARGQVRMEEERDETRAQLEHAAKLATLGELAAGIAHEINNPLAVISEEAGLMKDRLDPEFGVESDPAVIREQIASIEVAVFRCRDITRKLLGFVRRTEFKLESCDLSELVDETLEGLLSNELKVENIELVVTHDAEQPPVMVDRHQLAQVIVNLVNNAADAIATRRRRAGSSDGRSRGTIRVSTHPRDGHVELSVSDDGCGIPPDHRDRVFMPFFTTKDVGKGTGLGLSVTYGIIRGLGGRINFTSEPGRGTTFTIVLPAAVAKERQHVEDPAR
ncbi:MAG: ATP-binding protein [Candidatus Krumholzibacteriia bacterium]